MQDTHIDWLPRVRAPEPHPGQDGTRNPGTRPALDLEWNLSPFSAGLAL